MSFWERFRRGDESERAIRERRQETKQVANSKEEHYRVMREFAVEAGDEESVRYYDEKLADLKLLKDELDVLMQSGT